MANWQGAILTNKGRSLQAKVEGGLCQLALTKLKTGDGTMAPGQTLEKDVTWKLPASIAVHI